MGKSFAPPRPPAPPAPGAAYQTQRDGELATRELHLRHTMEMSRASSPSRWDDLTFGAFAVLFLALGGLAAWGVWIFTNLLLIEFTGGSF